ncbi:MAG: ADP-ribosylglycohydrolase family protein, partial [Nitrospinota bacterium]
MADLKSRFLGTILGAAVGDALGAPYEGLSGRALRRVKDLTSAYRPMGGYPLGQYTDDTQLTLAIAGSLAERGAVDGEDMARRFCELWRRGEIVGQGASCHEAVLKMLQGECSWQDAGTEEGRAGNGSAMRAGPL